MNALNWLATQLAWERRLNELRIERAVPTLARAKRPTSTTPATKAA